MQKSLCNSYKCCIVHDHAGSISNVTCKNKIGLTDLAAYCYKYFNHL